MIILQNDINKNQKSSLKYLNNIQKGTAYFKIFENNR